MKTQSLISTSLAMILAAMPSFAKSNNLDALKRDVWNPNWTTPADNGKIYYGSTKSPSAGLTKFDSQQIEFTSTTTTTPPPPQIMAFTPFLPSRTQVQEIHKHQPLKSII